MLRSHSLDQLECRSAPAIEMLESALIEAFEASINLGLRPAEALSIAAQWLAIELLRLEREPAPTGFLKKE
jgi:hypothetical protein